MEQIITDVSMDPPPASDATDTKANPVSTLPNKTAPPTIQSCLDSLVRCLEVQSTYSSSAYNNSNSRNTNTNTSSNLKNSSNALLLHPIHMNNLQQSYKLFQNAIRALRRTLLISISEPAPSARRLTLLRECAVNETTRLLARRLHRIARNLQGGNYLVSPSSSLSLSSSSSSSSSAYETLFPDSLGLNKESGRGTSVVKILEHAARSILGLEVFLDDMSSTDTLSLTMAGSVIVVDFVIERDSGMVNKANFTCSTDDSSFFIDIDGLLKDDLNSCDWLSPILEDKNKNGSDKEKEKENADDMDEDKETYKSKEADSITTTTTTSTIVLTTFIQHIQALLHLDIMNQAYRTYLLSAWKQSKELSNALRSSFESEWQNSNGDLQWCVQKGHGVVRTCAVEPHTSVLYHMDMSELAAKRRMNSSAPMEILPNDWEVLEHIYDVRVSRRTRHSVVASSFSSSSSSSPSSNSVVFTAFLKKPLPITDANCRKLAQVVVIENPKHDPNHPSQPPPSSSTFDRPYISNKEQHAWIEDVIFGENCLTNDVVYDVPSEQRPLRFSLTTRKHIPGFLLTRFSFTNEEQLTNASEIIRDQALLNELLRNTFHPAFRKVRPADADITNVTSLLEANNLTTTTLSISVHIMAETNSLALSWMGENDMEHIEAHTDGTTKGLEGRALRIFEKTRSIPATLINVDSL